MSRSETSDPRIPAGGVHDPGGAAISTRSCSRRPAARSRTSCGRADDEELMPTSGSGGEDDRPSARRDANSAAEAIELDSTAVQNDQRLAEALGIASQEQTVNDRTLDADRAHVVG